MHVNAKQIALSGLLAAAAAVLVVLSSVIEMSSLFFIAAASFCVGAAIREWGLRYGFAFWVASVILNFMVAPSKLYCFTYAGMGLYLVLSECLWEKIASSKTMTNRSLKLWLGKYVIFNVMYLPAIFLAPALVYAGEITGIFYAGAILGGQVVLFVYDKAYYFFQATMWNKLKRNF